MDYSITNPALIRQIADDPSFISKELYTSPKTAHKYAIGDILTLTGLTSYPDFNGTQVEITAYREDGDYGLAYYIKGPINQFINWTYEYRLTR